MIDTSRALRNVYRRIHDRWRPRWPSDPTGYAQPELHQWAYLLHPGSWRIFDKTRQGGYSWIMAYEAVTRYIPLGEPATLISQREKASIDWIKNIRTMTPHIPKVDRNGRKVDNALELAFPNGAYCLALPNRPESARYTHGHLFIDEWAHLERAEEITDAAIPLVTRGFNVTGLSSPNGQRGEFYKEVKAAKAGTGAFDYVGEFRVFKNPLSEINLGMDFHKQPHLNIMSKYITMDVLEKFRRRGKLFFLQEFLCQYLSSADAYFDYDVIEAAVAEYDLLSGADDIIKEFEMMEWA